MKLLIVAVVSAALLTLCWVVLERNNPVMMSRPLRVHIQKTAKNQSARKATATVDITGPLRHRKIVRQVLPIYPVWAEEAGVSGMLRISIEVAPNGRIRSHMPIVYTTGYPELDDVALDALRQWRFAAVPNATGDQWGTVAFRFSLMRTPPSNLPLQTWRGTTGIPVFYPGLPAY